MSPLWSWLLVAGVTFTFAVLVFEMIAWIDQLLDRRHERRRRWERRR